MHESFKTDTERNDQIKRFTEQFARKSANLPTSPPVVKNDLIKMSNLILLIDACFINVGDLSVFSADMKSMLSFIRFSKINMLRTSRSPVQ